MDLFQFSKSWVLRRYNKKQILIHAGDQVNSFFYLVKGYVKVYTITEEGEERILLILKPKDLFPLLKDPNRSGQLSLYFYSAMTKVELHIIDQKEILQKLKNNLEASWELLRYTSEFSNTLTNRLAQLEGKKAEDKLSSLLAYLISVCGKPTKLNFYLLDLKLTHQDIASLVGVSRETISVSIKKLEVENKVMYRNGFLLIHEKYASTI